MFLLVIGPARKSMIDPHYINEIHSDLRAIKEGWYAIDKYGLLFLGPFSDRETCLAKISYAVNWAEYKKQPISRSIALSQPRWPRDDFGAAS
jgi:hypothetical protein